jgi:hypothetical protein
LFVENYTEKDQVDLKGMQKGLETGAITKEDIANMLADQGNGDFEEAKGQFTPAQFNAMVALAGKDVVQQSFARINSGNARGGVVVNRPTYLPSTGTVVGEHGTFGGKGAAGGGIPMDGGPEAIIPLTGNRAQGFIEPIAASIAGAVMNQLAMSRVGMSSSGGGGAQNLTDASSTNNVITNNTIISSPEPTGQMLPGAGRDHATSHFRHAA